LSNTSEDTVLLATDVAVESPLWSAVPDIEALVVTAIDRAARLAGQTLRPGAEVSVLLTDDAQVQELNRIWRKQDKPTNVLSFPASGTAPLADAAMLGDIVIAQETVAREAANDAKSVEDHLVHLVVHGFLHLLGHDHQHEQEALAMEDLERVILASLAIADPYADKS
jgi:probable rRNA maturation factor